MHSRDITVSCGLPLFSIPTSSSLPADEVRRWSREDRPTGWHRRSDCRLGIDMIKSMILSESEYEALPPALREPGQTELWDLLSHKCRGQLPLLRKCFSSVERLRIAENAVASPLNLSTEPRIPLYASEVPNDTAPVKVLRRQSTRSRRRLRKSESLSGDFSQADAQWFLALPEKVRRRHFSQEEQVLLAGRCESLLSGIDYEYPTNLRGDTANDKSTSATPVRGRMLSARGSPFEDSTEDIDTVIKNAFHFLEKTECRQLEQNVFAHSSAVSGAMTPSPPIRQHRPSFRRTLPFSQYPFARHSISSPPISPHPSQHPSRPRATLLVSGRPCDKPAVPAMPDPEAKYYHDPEARMKLKLYLGTPEKFDEVVEYGFPSDSTVAPERPAQRPRPHARKFSNETHVYLKNQTVFFLDDSESSDDETDDEDECEPPLTPCESELMRYNPQIVSSKYSSIDSAGLPSPSIRLKTPELFSNREMTLRMTLTRPDLRTAEEMHLRQNHGQHAPVDEDPLALAALPPLTEDNTGSGGPFIRVAYKDRRMMHRLWKRVKIGGVRR